MATEYGQIEWDERAEADCRRLALWAVREDLVERQDRTCALLTGADRSATARMIAREPLIVCGLPALSIILAEFSRELTGQAHAEEGGWVEPGSCLAVLEGAAGDLLAAERTVLNVLSHLSGIATLTGHFCRRIGKLPVRIYDTRKTLPGWRRLQKYAVRCGGGWNHRMGLHDAVLIKDNHLAMAGRGLAAGATGAAIELLRKAQARRVSETAAGRTGSPIEIEVDTLAQLEAVLPEGPDIVLLDNMTIGELTTAVELRNRIAPQAVLEASGGVSLETVGAIAATGVDRISAGSLTHSAPSADIGLDWGLAGA